MNMFHSLVHYQRKGSLEYSFKNFYDVDEKKICRQVIDWIKNDLGHKDIVAKFDLQSMQFMTEDGDFDIMDKIAKELEKEHYVMFEEVFTMLYVTEDKVEEYDK